MAEDKIEALVTKFDNFIQQYELDMRGDKHLDNGNKGVIGEIRAIKTYQKDYPSLIWLLKKYPIKVGGSILAGFLLLMSLYQLGVIKILLAYFGVSTP